MTKQINIGFLIYPGVVQLDVMGAYQVLAFPPNSNIHLIWKNAEMTQLMMEYDPQPPFNAGSPETTNKFLVESLTKLGSPLIEAFWTGIK